MAWLEYAGRMRRLADGETTVGGTPTAGVPVPDGDLLPRHFALRVAGEKTWVRPWSLDSVVAVNGQQIAAQECELDDGDTISAGSVHFRVWRGQPELASRVTDEAHNRQPLTAHLIDPRESVAYPLDRLSTNIGRSSANVIRVKDPTASRFHAQVRREAGGFALHSVGSSGTRVNGQRVGPPQLLDEGDEIEIAYTTLRYTRQKPPQGVTIVPRSPGGAADAAERPTIARERTSLRRFGARAVRGRMGPSGVVAGVVLLALILAAVIAVAT